MMETQQLFDKDLIFFEEASDTEELFKSIGQKLFDRGLVKEGYVTSLAEREKNFPTGLDLSVVGNNTPNVAIPHTEVEFCNWKGIAVAILKNPIDFRNMIAPSKHIDVRFAFFILNNEKNSQTNLLSYLMSFFTQDDKVSKLSEMTDSEEIFQYLNSK